MAARITVDEKQITLRTCRNDNACLSLKMKIKIKVISVYISCLLSVNPTGNSMASKPLLYFPRISPTQCTWWTKSSFGLCIMGVGPAVGDETLWMMYCLFVIIRLK